MATLTTVETSFGTGSRRRGVFTWAQAAALTGNIAGDTVEVSDLGYAVFAWNGSLWRPRSPVLLGASAVAMALTGTTSEAVMATVPVPAGAMGLNGGLKVEAIWGITNSANAKVMRTRLGGLAGTSLGSTSLTANASYAESRIIRNRNSASAQVSYLGTGGTGSTTAAIGVASINSAVAQDLVLTGAPANAADSITLQSYEVWLLP